jgi:hypothetical protein
MTSFQATSWSSSDFSSDERPDVFSLRINSETRSLAVSSCAFCASLRPFYSPTLLISHHVLRIWSDQGRLQRSSLGVRSKVFQIARAESLMPR